MSSLPEFQRKPRAYAEHFIRNVLTGHQVAKSTLLALQEQPGGYYRAVFSPLYFALAEDEMEPSKSQWSSLKKKLKRHNKAAFVLKEHGKTESTDGEPAYYILFGFLEQDK